MILVLVIFFALLLLGPPIGYAIGLAGIAGILQSGNVDLLRMAPQRFFAGLDEFTFLAIPFFILAGEVMNRIGLTNRLIDFAQALVGHWRGGLAQTNMLASVMFGGMSGVGTADAAAFGNTIVPAMVRKGYNRPFACAVTAAGSILAPTIPPSNLMVLYGALMSTSIAGLFASGVLPALLICMACMALIGMMARRGNLPPGERRRTLLELGAALGSAAWALVMPIIVLGGMLGGVVTATEAAAVAVFYALFVGTFVYRNLSVADLIDSLIRTARITGVVFLIIGAASILGWWLAFEQLPQAIAEVLLGLTTNNYLLIGLVVLILLVFGMFMDVVAILILLAPILGPVVLAAGMDPIHAGLVFVLALNISLMTPPVGACLFVLCSVTGERMENIINALWPFLIVQVTLLFLIAYVPSIALVLPRLLGF